jgi:hypothetical protein
MMTIAEFYIDDSDKYVAVCDISAAPRTGEFICIEKIQYVIIQITWCVDHASEWHKTQLRANVVIHKTPG